MNTDAREFSVDEVNELDGWTSNSQKRSLNIQRRTI